MKRSSATRCASARKRCAATSELLPSNCTSPAVTRWPKICATTRCALPPGGGSSALACANAAGRTASRDRANNARRPSAVATPTRLAKFPSGRAFFGFIIDRLACLQLVLLWRVPANAHDVVRVPGFRDEQGQEGSLAAHYRVYARSQS